MCEENSSHKQALIWSILGLAVFGVCALYLLPKLLVNVESSELVPLHILTFGNGDEIEILHWDFNRSSILKSQSSKPVFGSNSGTGSGSDWGGMYHQGRSGKWMQSEYTTDQAGLVVIARAYDSYRDILLTDGAYKSVGGAPEAVKYDTFSGSGALLFDRFNHGATAVPDWGLEFQLSDGNWLPFRGPLIACQEDGRAFFNAQFFPNSSDLAIRGKIGEQYSKPITIDTLGLGRLGLRGTKINQLGEPQDMGEFNVTLTRLERDERRNGLQCSWAIESNVSEQTKDSWVCSHRHIGDDLGNAGRLGDYLDLPEAKLIQVQLWFQNSDAYRWHLNDARIVASGVVPDNYKGKESIPLIAESVDLSNVKFKHFNFRKNSTGSKNRLPEWAIKYEAQAGSASSLSVFTNNALWVLFLEDQEYSHGESAGGGSSSSENLLIHHKVNGERHWHGNLNPGDRFRLGLVTSKRVSYADFWFPKEVIEQ